jgi:ribosomal protein L7/L12
VLEVYDQVDWGTFKPAGPPAPDNHTPAADAAEWIHRATAASHVRAELAADRKINAIKEMRAASGMGLKEAKDAVEAYQWKYKPLTIPTRR